MRHTRKFFFFIALLSIMGSACKSDKADKKITAKEKNIAQADTYHYAYSFKMKQPGSDELTPSGSSDMYFSEEGVRSETNLKILGNETEMVMLVKADSPNEIIMLDDETKTYSIFNPEDLEVGGEMAKKMAEMSSDSLTVLGKEKMNGYECTHLQIVTTANVPESIKKMMGDTQSVEEYWVSKELPGRSVLESWAKTQPKMSRGMNSEIYEYGVPVKMVSKEGDAITMVMELEEAKGEDQDKGLFEIPSGYSKIE